MTHKLTPIALPMGDGYVPAIIHNDSQRAEVLATPYPERWQAIQAAEQFIAARAQRPPRNPIMPA